MLPSLSRALVGLLNAVIEENAAFDLNQLEGRSLAITIDELPQDIAFQVQNQRLQELPVEQLHTADVTISGNIKAIINMLQDADTGLESDELYITGKISTAKHFQHFLSSLSLDWQAIFRKMLPEPLAEKVGDAVTQGLHFSKGAAEQMGERLKTYLLDEKKYLVRKSELAQLSQDIQALHQQLDRVAKKLDTDNTKH